MPDHLLDYQGLKQVLALIERLRQEKGLTEEGDYDGLVEPEPSSEAQNDPGNSKQRTDESDPGVGSVKRRSSGWSDPVDGAVSAQTGTGTDRESGAGGPQ